MTLVAICGPAGAGKTALAVHWAHQTIESFPDGQIYVDLRGYSADRTLTTGETLTRILSSLGVPDRDIPTGWAGKVSFYRTQTAGRRLLLLLDNARSADQVRALLPGGPGCAVLVTSRATLRGLVARNGAQHLELGLLSAAEATRLLRATVGTARISADPAATATLVDMCHGLPLALRIVAADLVTHPGVPLDAYAAELARRTPLSALDVPGDAEASLRAAFDLSFHALTPPAQRLFPLLGLAPGPDFGTAAAVALTGRPRPEVETALRELVDAHLVERPRPERFRLHDLLRQYAIQRATASVPPTERAAAIERLYGWHVRSADACTRLLYPHVTMRMPIPAGPAVAPRTTAEALDWLAEESVVHVALAHADGPPELVWLLADALRSYFNRHAGQDAWLSVAGAARAAARAVAAAHPDRVDAWTGAASAALSLAYAHHCAADKEQAAILINEATDACDRAQWTQGRSAAVNLLGMIRHDQGRLADAATCYEQALALDRRLGNDADVAIDLNNLGRVYQDMGRLDRAAAHYRTALRHHERAGAASAAAICRTNLGHVRLLGGSHRAAFSLLQRALSEHRDYGDRQGEAYATGGLALAQLHLGQLRDAEQSARSAVELAQGLGSVITADAYIVLGAVRRRLGDIERARQAYAEALSYADDCTYAYGKVQALLGLDAFAEAATAARQGGFRLLESQALWALARRRRQLGPPARGRKMLRVARTARAAMAQR
ncbi:MAG: tetratricopeptide repeat protein [Streptomycetaceae bacterium]|nr:tetratricopeptide repeat protein [Streptomycetaceae bacterium]